MLIAGLLLAMAGLALPARQQRIAAASSRLDEFVPVWQFNEVHAIEVAAPPESVFKAIRAVRSDEILFFRALTWIRRGGRSLPEGVLNAPANAPLIDAALRGGFVKLAEQPPTELVIGTLIAAPANSRARFSREIFGKTALSPGLVVAAMDFRVSPDGRGRSRVSTETRVFASSAPAARRFAVYWRLIYPGSAIIRVMWLRAIRERAESPS